MRWHNVCPLRLKVLQRRNEATFNSDNTIIRKHVIGDYGEMS